MFWMYTSLIYIVMCSKKLPVLGFVDQRENKKATRRNEKILGSNIKCQLFQLPDVFLNKCACLVLWSYVFRIGQ